MGFAIPNVYQMEPGFVHTQSDTPPNFPETGLEGCVASLGFTTWGPEGLTLVRSHAEFERYFGTSLSDNYPSSRYLKYMFDNSAFDGGYAPLFFKRVFNYSDPNDASTLTATKAEGALYDANPEPAVVGAPAHTGTGDDTLTVSGTFTGTTKGTYTVKVTTAGASYADCEVTLSFTPEGGTQATIKTEVPISGTVIVLEHGLSVTLTDGGDTTLVLNDEWSFDVTPEGKSAGDERIKVTGKYYGSLGNLVSVKAVTPDDATVGDFTLQVYLDGVLKETYSDLSLDVDSTQYFAPIVNNQSNYIIVEDTNNIDDIAIDTSNGVGDLLVGGSDGNVPVLADYLGSSDASTGVHGFSETLYPVRIVCPDAIVGSIDYVNFVRGLDAYIKGFNGRASQFISVPKNLTTEAGVSSFVNNSLQMDSEFGFMYFGFVRDTVTGEYVDPSCALAGLSSKTARNRTNAGVWTNFAGEGFPLVGFDAVHVKLNPTVAGVFNELGVNVLKVSTTVGVYANGCRTMTKTKKRDYKYIAQVLNTQDCAYLVENSLKWVKFKNLSDALYSTMASTVTSVLEGRNQEGGFNTEDGVPYAVVCDNGIQTEEMKAKGIVLLKWGIRNRFCAEFVWLHFTNMTSGASL